MAAPTCRHGERMYYPDRISKKNGQHLAAAWLCKGKENDKCPMILASDLEVARGIMNNEYPNFMGAQATQDIPPWELIDPDELTELIKIADTLEDLDQLWAEYKKSWVQSVHSPIASRRRMEIRNQRLCS